MTEKIPVFGEKLDSVDYQARFGVYGIVSRLTADKNEEFCLVQAPNGSFLLPGGEIESGENQEAALKRELLEELGADCQLGDYLGEADEYFYSSHRDKYFYNPAYIYEMKNVDFAHEPLEEGNGIFWFPFDEAIAKLKRGSHKWGLEEYKKRAH